MTKYFFLFSFFFLIPMASHATEIACTMEYAPVCGQPPMPECPVGMACIQVMPAPQTYGNSCTMKAAGATLIHSGECTALPTTGACTREYMPVCGMVQVQCITTPCDPVRTDFSNLCMAKAAGATDITDGTCIMSESTPPIVGGDRDIHGCIGSAGYSWDESLKSCIRAWEYQDEVSWAYENKVTRYDALADFKYGNILTRQEAATLVTRAAEYIYGREIAQCKVAYKDSNLFDISLTPGISRACGMGIMQGQDGYFSPLRGLTRGEALAILIRSIDGKKLDESKNPWYQVYMDRAFDLGLVFANMQGFGEPITRGEFIEWMKTLTEKSLPSDENLLGEWKLESLRIDDMMFAGSGNVLTFTPDRYSIKLCNSISGEYTARNGLISAGPAMSTMMACMDGHLMTMESIWNLEGATYVIQSTRGDPRIWLKITLKGGGEFTFIR